MLEKQKVLPTIRMTFGAQHEMFYFSSRLKVQTVKTFILAAAQTEMQLDAQMFALLHSFYRPISIWQIWKMRRPAWVQLQRRQSRRSGGGVSCGTQQRCSAVLNQPSAGTKDSPSLDTPGHRQCDPTVSPEEVQSFTSAWHKRTRSSSQESFFKKYFLFTQLCCLNIILLNNQAGTCSFKTIKSHQFLEFESLLSTFEVPPFLLRHSQQQ